MKGKLLDYKREIAKCGEGEMLFAFLPLLFFFGESIPLWILEISNLGLVALLPIYALYG